MYCTNCGKPIADNSNFCCYCGFSFANQVASEPAPAVSEVKEGLILPKIEIEGITLPKEDSLKFVKYDPIAIELFKDETVYLPSEFVHFKKIKEELTSIKLVSYILNQLSVTLNSLCIHDFDSFYNDRVIDALRQPYMLMSSICCHYYAAYGVKNITFQSVFDYIWAQSSHLSDYFDGFEKAINDIYDANYIYAVNRANSMSGMPFFGISGLIASYAIDAHNENMINNVALAPQQKQYLYSTINIGSIIQNIRDDIEEIYLLLVRDLFANGARVFYVDNTVVSFVTSNLKMLDAGEYPEEERKEIFKELFLKMPYDNELICAIYNERKKDETDYSDSKYDISEYTNGTEGLSI